LKASRLVESSAYELAGEVESAQVCRLVSIAHELEKIANKLEQKF